MLQLSDTTMGQLASEVGGWDREIEGVCWEPRGEVSEQNWDPVEQKFECPYHNQTLKPIHSYSPTFVFAHKSLDLVVPLESSDRCEALADGLWILSDLSL